MPAINFSMFVPIVKLSDVLFTDDNTIAHLEEIHGPSSDSYLYGKASHCAYVDNSGEFLLAIPEGSQLRRIYMYDAYTEEWKEQYWSEVTSDDTSVGMAYYSLDEPDNPVLDGYSTYRFRDLDGDGELVARSYQIAFLIV